MASPSKKARKETPIGVTQWTVGGYEDGRGLGFEALAAAKRLGFQTIQIDSGFGGWRGFPNVAEEGVVQKYLDEMTKTGVTISGVGVNGLIEGPETVVTKMNSLPACDGCSALDEDPTKARQALCEALAAAKQLGATTVYVPSFFASRMKTDADMKRTADLFRSVAGVARILGITLASENTLDAEKCRKFVELCGDANVRILVDTQNYHIFSGLDAPSVCEKLKDLMCDHYHAKEGKDVVAPAEGHAREGAVVEGGVIQLFPSMGNSQLADGDSGAKKSIGALASQPVHCVISEQVYSDDDAGKAKAAIDIEFLRSFYAT